mmetsp:Transcript_501/g.998  ORF Transcript_501/g.998 Transcript_501/m.998 type:complete len:843 (-) Transcript_501:58-2586(-)|eukprot:CAMPEP_0172298936 /NCGR_PEP_ID=MMETSP1058-20130122/1357_1 /TAXON_ID=83371 /ORGANISM="Detonula confervacea, Strain CCMP 353" /LENGTH=842 /DNA_ID=CAMNT_0013008231 /DNA_START=11 /DNA_END=2539 /DNA_ORIENTATION=-
MRSRQRQNNDNDGDESKSSRYDSNFDLSEFNKQDMMSNYNKPQPQPATAAVNSIHWEVEEDHLLSYFLGANEGTNDNIPEIGSAVEQNPNDPINVEPTSIRPASLPSSSANLTADGAGLAHNSSLESFVHARAKESPESGGAGLPPAPGVNFYDGHYRVFDGHYPPANPPAQGTAPAAMAMGATQAHSVGYNSFVHASQQQRHSSNSLQNRTSSAGSMHKVPSRTSTTNSCSSSSSSLASMAAALALGGPNQVMYMQQKLQSRDQLTSVHHQLNNTSPITPLNMMGGSPSGQEMMMLPPPPRFPNGHPGMMQHPHNMPQTMQQQHIMYTQQQMPMHQQQPNNMQQQMPQQPLAVPSNRPSPQPTNNMASQENAQPQKQPHFLPQMNPSVGSGIQHPRPMHHMGFPDPNSVTSAVLGQPQMQMQAPQQSQQQQQPQQQPAQPQQIQIGLNGQTIPITAVSNPNGSVYYQIDPSVVPAAGLRYFTKAINEVSKPEETELDPKVLAEKRKQRLARNRESARQSRRRKKEHLSNLGANVQNLQTQLELEVRDKIRSMEDGLVRQRADMLDKWLVGYQEERMKQSPDEQGVISVRCGKELVLAVQKTSANSQIRRAVIAHQYNMLRQAFFSSHNHYSVWMMMQSSSFFTEAVRQQHTNLALVKEGTTAVAGDGSGNASRTINSRPNSKQIGEEIFYEQQMEGKGNVTCEANDELRTWPLYCHEVTMTMDQEDKIINQAHIQAKSTSNLQAKLQKMKKATDATHHLQNAMLCHTQLASTRNETLLLEILTPAQTALFKEYMKKNKERLMAIMEQQLRASYAAGLAGNAQPESTLGGVYQELEEMRLQE